MTDVELVAHKLATLVQGYDEVDLEIVEDAVRNRLDDLLAFTAAVRARLP